ncbi:mechanosensitive ion channel family protein [Nakamurella flavida]|uniref:Mechanosensitive ion channel family protein n=1 Tax=Nakamurella flavida TaxID=363630 RepID=A0A938YGQ9_9ACTN|nr:mechanosensitive ion channel family protein [Nakamurella flavida]MBM9477380.1 mechanosensitive ion channel family protein [Nakamurella flavida]MDP9777312.1 small-conductance mechanosensitive channel [Nakamurella flavida]
MTSAPSVPPTDPVPAEPASPRSGSVPAEPETESLGVRARRRSRSVLGAVNSRTKPDLKRAVPTLLISLIAFAVGANLGGVRRSTQAEFDLFGWRFDIPAPGVVAIVIALTVVFVVAGVIAGRSIARELGRVSEARANVEAGSAIRLICMILAYVTVGFGVLSLLQVNLGNLLIGGAVTGVVVGIAAQQTLGNFFAGLVLLFARPYVPGQRVKVRSGAMGGPFEGVIVGAGIMYTVIDTDEGMVSMPNAGLLGSAIGPAPEPKPEGETVADGEAPAEAADQHRPPVDLVHHGRRRKHDHSD